MKVGITGHQELADPLWVEQEIARIVVSQGSPLIGVTSLAVGADQIFAQAVLNADGALHVVVPFAGYAEVFKPEGRQDYERLLASASITEVLPATHSEEEAFFAAGKRMVNISEMVVAVWNGKPAAGLGGTADVVAYARSQKRRYIHINPVSREVFFYA